MEINKHNILITGGASGIGKIMGRMCLEQKAKNLVIWDFNEANLNQTIKEFAQKGFANVHPFLLDVSDLDSIKWASDAVLQEFGSIDILFNNAGIVVGKAFQDHSFQEIEKTLAINVSAVMNITKAFLPAMIEKNKGHIVNIASAAGLMANPKMSVYAASKWAVLGWSESLRLELEQISENLHVTTATPSYIKTGMFQGVKMTPLIPLLNPEKIAEKIIEAVKNNEILLREPFMVKALPFLRGALPTRAFDFLAGKVLNVYDSMNHFVGHSQSKN